MSGETMKWLPLESNPDVMNKFLQNLGVPEDWSIVDVLGLDKELQIDIPQPVASVLLLFPTGEKHEAFSKQQEEDIQDNGQVVGETVYFMRQTIKNACGTVALIHAVANSKDQITLAEESPLQQFLEATADMQPEDRGLELEKSEAISAAHEMSAQEGQTEAPPADEDVNLHFVTFAHVDGSLYELDGRKSFPINHGNTSPDTLLEDASAVCKQFVERDPDNVNFNVVALVPGSA